MVPCCCNRDSLKFDMQHDQVLKKYNFDLLTPSQGLGEVYGLNIFYHVDALACNMTMFCKIVFRPLNPNPRVRIVSMELGRGLGAKYLLPCFCIRDLFPFI